MTAPVSRPARERLGSWCFVFGIVLSAFGGLLIDIEGGRLMLGFGIAFLVASQLLHPFWRPHWKPPPQPPQPTLGEFGLAPKQGEHYVAGEHAGVEVCVWWKPMGSSAFEAELPPGTLVISAQDHDASMHRVYVSPADYAAIEALLVSRERKFGSYNGYSLSVAPGDFSRAFRRF